MILLKNCALDVIDIYIIITPLTDRKAPSGVQNNDCKDTKKILFVKFFFTFMKLFYIFLVNGITESIF